MAGRQTRRDQVEQLVRDVKRLWRPKSGKATHQKKRSAIAKLYSFTCDELLYNASEKILNDDYILENQSAKKENKESKTGKVFTAKVHRGLRAAGKGRVTPELVILRHALKLSSAAAHHPNRLICLGWDREITPEKFEKFVLKHGYAKNAYDLAKRNWKAPKE